MPKKPKDIVLAPIHPNLGVEEAYRKRLLRLVNEMAKSINWFIRAAYRANEPATVAMDADAADILRRKMEDLSDRWRKRFDEGAEELASYFAKASGDRTDAALKAALKRAGFTIEFRPTRAQRDVMKSTVDANVSLISSVPEQYLEKVQGAVYRSVQVGGDLGTLVKDLEQIAGVTRRRASLIARSQNSMATAALKRARFLELNITEARWVHSGGGRTVRPSHVKASKDGVVFDVAKGWFDPDEGKWVQPGQLINCRCNARPIIKALQ